MMLGPRVVHTRRVRQLGSEHQGLFGGQGQGRTAELPLLRRLCKSSTDQPTVPDSVRQGPAWRPASRRGGSDVPLDMSLSCRSYL